MMLLPVLGKCFYSVDVPLSTTLTISPVVLPPSEVQNAAYDQSHFESSLFSVRTFSHVAVAADVAVHLF